MKGSPSSGEHSAEQNEPPDRSQPFHFEFAKSTHDYMQEYIRLADQKSAFVFGASTAGVAFLYQSSKPQAWLSVPGNWRVNNLLALSAMIALACAGALAISVVKPRRKGPRFGLIFWDAVVERSSGNEYATNVLESSGNELLTEYLRHTYDLAKVCRAKYDWLHYSFLTFLIGLVLAAVYFSLFAPL
jgi:hypothetical protein